LKECQEKEERERGEKLIAIKKKIWSQVHSNTEYFTATARWQLAKEIFELDAGAGFGVAVFDDYGAGEGESPLFAAGVRDGARTGDYDGVLGDDQR